MKTPLKWLLIAALAPVLGFAQEAPNYTSPVKTPHEFLVAEMTAVKTMAAAALAEQNLANAIAAGALSRDEQTQDALMLYRVYRKMITLKLAPDGEWARTALRKYAPADGALPATISLVLASTLTEAAAAEIEAAKVMPDLSPDGREALAAQIFDTYLRIHGKPASWIWAVLPKYIPNWETNTTARVRAYYFNFITLPATFKLATDLKAVPTVEAMDAALTAYLATNLLPERLQPMVDSRDRAGALGGATAAAVRLGHPEAVNYAIALYRSRTFSEEQINTAVAIVAKALKAKDMNLVRANAFIAYQNTGVDGPTITDAEKALPTALANSPVAALFKPVTLAEATAVYRDASTSANVDAGVYKIAEALKAVDLNVARANAWIKSQKDGVPFDLK